jgi:hypothetical protein
MRRSGYVGAIILASMCVLSGSASAQRNSKNHPNCRYQNGYEDGCAQAAADGNYVNPNFFTYAKQSGQGRYYRNPAKPSGHPPPWNVAGVDYPVGYGASRKLYDPAKGLLPPGCSYSATGSQAGGAIVICANVVNLTLGDWDFSLHNCTVLDIKSTVTGIIAIKNSKFVNGQNCSVKNGYLVMVENPSMAAFRFEHNYVDGLAKQYPTSLIGLIVPFVQGAMVMKYNAFLHSPARPITSGDEGPLVFAYNYWEGWVYQPSDGHGEVVINYLGDNKNQPSTTYSFNTALEGNDVCSGCGTSVWYPTGGGQNTTIGVVVIDHNTSIVNTHEGEKTVAASAAETSYDTYGSVTFEQNYTDPTGSYACFLSESNPTYLTQPVFTGNVNMINGSAITDFGQ